MHQAETRALRRATLMLVLVSALRWAWSSAAAPRTGEEPESVLPELLDESREATQEGERRAAPLVGDEKVDPNRATEVELDRLPGVGPATARAVVAAREAGTVFRRPEDLESVPGIGSATVERLRAVLDLRDPPPPPPGRAPRAPARVDLNRADLEALQTLPGVGPALARRIVDARQERMFTSVDDLGRVKGIGPATIERFRSRATVSR